MPRECFGYYDGCSMWVHCPPPALPHSAKALISVELTVQHSELNISLPRDLAHSKFCILTTCNIFVITMWLKHQHDVYLYLYEYLMLSWRFKQAASKACSMYLTHTEFKFAKGMTVLLRFYRPKKRQKCPNAHRTHHVRMCKASKAAPSDMNIFHTIPCLFPP